MPAAWIRLRAMIRQSFISLLSIFPSTFIQLFFFFLLFSGILKQGPTWTDVIKESGFC
jgi:hypothetical protein